MLSHVLSCSFLEENGKLNVNTIEIHKAEAWGTNVSCFLINNSKDKTSNDLGGKEEKEMKRN